MSDVRKINLRVIPRSKQNKITQEGEKLRIHITAAPVGGAANIAVIKLLSEYFDVPKSRIKIVRGDTARDKVIEILD